MADLGCLIYRRTGDIFIVELGTFYRRTGDKNLPVYRRTGDKTAPQVRENIGESDKQLLKLNIKIIIRD